MAGSDSHGRVHASSGVTLKVRGEDAVYFERSEHSAKINRHCQAGFAVDTQGSRAQFQEAPLGFKVY
jgi:hypothetical protein